MHAKPKIPAREGYKFCPPVAARLPVGILYQAMPCGAGMAKAAPSAGARPAFRIKAYRYGRSVYDLLHAGVVRFQLPWDGCKQLPVARLLHGLLYLSTDGIRAVRLGKQNGENGLLLRGLRQQIAGQNVRKIIPSIGAVKAVRDAFLPQSGAHGGHVIPDAQHRHKILQLCKIIQQG